MAIKVCVDQGVNLKALRRLQSQGFIELHQANELEQPFRKVVQDSKGFMVGHTKLGRDVLADEKIVHELERIIGLENRIDIGHIYASYLNESEYFVTNDVTDFISGGRRQKLESVLHPMKIRGMKEFLQQIATGEE